MVYKGPDSKISFALSAVLEYIIIERTGDDMFRTIPIWDVDRYIESSCDILLVDLRDRRSYEESHIKGAVNLPFEEMDSWFYRLPRDKMLIFYCFRGGQSMMVCRDLERLGYYVINVANGIAYYRGKYMVQG